MVYTLFQGGFRSIHGAVWGQGVAHRGQAQTGKDRHHRCGRCVLPPALRAVNQSKHLRNPICRNPGNGKEFEPSRRLSETTRQRSVSAFRVAFLGAQVTERRAPSKRATARFTLRAPRWWDRCRRPCPRRLSARTAANPSAHVTSPHRGLTARRTARRSAWCRRRCGVRCTVRSHLADRHGRRERFDAGRFAAESMMMDRSRDRACHSRSAAAC